MRTTAAFIFILAALLSAGCSKKEEQGGASNATAAYKGTVSELAGVQTRPGSVPNFSWKNSAGKTVSIDAFKGRVTLVNFWATWCVPCKKEIPDLIAISNELAARNVTVIGISTDRGSSVLDDVGAFVTEKGIPYQILISNDDLESAFGNIRAIPTTFVVDANGTIVKEMVGFQTKESFTAAITAAMK
jgi:thiol-disulfide isomerase/thioredoxin